MSKAHLVFWGYFVEIVAATLVFAALSLIFDLASIITFVRNAAIDVATLFCGIMFAAALGFLWTLYSKIDNPFYLWLDKIQALEVYLKATGYAVAISAAATLSLIGMKYSANDILAGVALFLLLLAVINLYTLVQNVFGLMRLNAKYCQEREARKRN